MVVGSLTLEKEVVVIGGGPGGYISAIRASQRGKDVTLIDKDGLGGICLNKGCIPLNAFNHLVKTDLLFKKSKELGITFDNYAVDFTVWQKFRQRKVMKLKKGIEFLLKSHGVEYVKGTAAFISENEIRVEGDDGRYTVEFEQAIIAAGAKPAVNESAAFDGTNILSVYEILSMENLPKSLVLAGTQDSGIAVAQLCALLGTDVTVLFQGDRLFPFLDPDAEKALVQSFKKHKVKLESFQEIIKAEKGSKGVTIHFNNGNGEKSVTAEKAVLSTKYVPSLSQLNIDSAKIERDSFGFIKTDAHMRTSNKNVFAVGDVNGGLLYANKAAFQAKVAADVIGGQKSEFKSVVIPRILYTIPEVAWAGLQEHKAQSENISVKASKFTLGMLGKNVVSQSEEGFVKLIFEKDSGIILGGLIVGENAGHFISQITMAIEMAAHIDDFSLTVPVHPTTPEAFMEAADDFENLSVHMAKKT